MDEGRGFTSGDDVLSQRMSAACWRRIPDCGRGKVLLCALGSIVIAGRIACDMYVNTVPCSPQALYELTRWEDGVVPVTGSRLLCTGDASFGSIAADAVVMSERGYALCGHRGR